MADRKKRVMVGKTQQPLPSKTTLKQKTLFDSFPSKKGPNLIIDQPPDNVIDAHPRITAAGPSVITGPPSPPSIIDLTIARMEIPSPELEIVDNIINGGNLTGSRSVGGDVELFLAAVEDAVESFAPAMSFRPNYISQPTKPEKPALHGKTPDKPIFIDSSPIKAPSSSQRATDKPTHHFFKTKTKDLTTTSLPFKTRSSQTILQMAPYPDCLSQHVRGSQTRFETAAPFRFPSRLLRRTEAISEGLASYAFLKKSDVSKHSNLKSSIPSSRYPQSGQALEYGVNYPLIARSKDQDAGSLRISRQPWSEKWQPTCAQEVLGNENSATYLREWLRALELQLEDKTTNQQSGNNSTSSGKVKPLKRGTKRPRVVRVVEKPRARKKSRRFGDEHHWIVNSDESEEEVVQYPMVDDAEGMDVELSAQLQSSNDDALPLAIQNQWQKLGQLHNTILLEGPQGIGKTASVYACAEELGWDVFEVYPGIGKRNGASVDNLVGDVGKNHLVHPNHRNSYDVPNSFLLKSNSPNLAESDESPYHVGPSYHPRKRLDPEIIPNQMLNNNNKPIRQSLILLEEVDILFKEDVNFWNTVTRIIKECKRPVICTCNDVSLVPLSDLPLQTILKFEPCPPDIATSYLQSLCSAEGYLVDQKYLHHLYTATQSQDQWPLVAVSRNDVAAPDLRRTIHTLQVLCTSRDYLRSESAIDQSIEAFSRSPSLAAELSRFSTKRSEFLSYLDSELILDSGQAFVATELANYTPSNDDEMGHTILYDPHAKDTAQFGLHGRQKEIAWSAIHHSRALFGVDVKSDAQDIQANYSDSVIFQSQLRPVLREVCPLATWCRGDASLYTEYSPIIRQIVAEDDMQEAFEIQTKPRAGRNTRNSTRSGHVRTITLTAEGRRGLDLSVFSNNVSRA
ncbi:hypothetical protein B0H34DRAFT_688843 [Crassisporium funariophilum]|nr:hypothetical protein B0H34DRAFT_688843 [Crassisporium funariophilum]